MTVEQKKSMEINMLLNMIRGLAGAIFPLITFPYVTRILSVENIGKYNFANSIINFFLLLAGLGIQTYAIKEGASKRENKIKLEAFVAQMFTINILSTVISYVMLFICIIFIHKLENYRCLLLILSLQIAFKTMGAEWLYSVYEEYAYITIRTILFQFISFILIFVLVKESTDVSLYAVATVLATVGSGMMNLFYSKKYCNLKITIHLDLNRHIRPIMVLFATAVTVTVYVSSDTAVLGFMCGDYHVGIYTISVKIYTLLKTVLSSAIIVAIPRMAMLAGRGRQKEFCLLGNKIYKTFLTFIFPSIIGVIVLRREIICLVAGKNFINAHFSLILLALALFFALGAGFWSQAVMIPLNGEKRVFMITAVSAGINLILNIIMIPFWKENAAALTTVIAEFVVFLYCRHNAIKYVDTKGVTKLLIKVIIGCLPMIVIGIIVKAVMANDTVAMILIVSLCIVEYFVLEYLLNNEIVLGAAGSIKNKFGKTTSVSRK